jgi:hypothetical protein
MTVRSNFSVVLLLALGLFAGRETSASSTAEIIVSVPDQALAVIDRGKEIAQYRISTSKFGNGDSPAAIVIRSESFTPKGAKRGL